ncbi:MAG: 30S ribosomal protein S5 [Chloroflexi bacterium]|jgi:small subunit ribosomal protein S5|nr:30S ribosomal protein S5 [Chloroflexota bacterium]MCH2532269.1 30S ribosomal protein S5 [Dehalococcoidia bacterium]HCH36234.1 30S ribosomal protein S5 [Dehalococcoidia bacterium]|tara:strand:- start:2817 stop:3461 length:645 start_codon:yes stop_codon:yes gene_type:complete
MVSTERTNEDQLELQEKVVQIRRVAKVVKGGRNLTFNAMVVVGDGEGSVGAGLGKGKAVPDAVRQGVTIAKKEMVTVPLKGSTIPHAVTTKFRASKVLLRPARPGAGIKAGGAVRAVMEAVGIKDVVGKALGSRNPINIVKATLQGLSQLQSSDTREAQSSGRAILPPAPDRRLPLRREMSSRRDREDREKKEPNPADQATEEVNQVKPEVIEE